MLTHSDCEKIVANNKSFIEKTDIIQGYEISQYTYRLANYTDFLKPLEDSDISAFQMRGISFCNNQRYLMFDKLFNINQTIGYMYDDIKNKLIDYVQDKIDGFLIRFIKLPNGNAIAKSMFSFESEQAIAAMKIYNSNINLRAFVDFTLNHDMGALFEYTSPTNQIVVQYPNDKLTLLAIIKDSWVFDTYYYSKEFIIEMAEIYNVPVTTFYNYTLDELISKAETEIGIKGWVVTFEDGQKVKIKTKWYLNLHGLLTSVVKNESDIIACILDNNIDDLLSNLPQESIEIREKIINLTKNISNYISENKKHICNIMSFYNGIKKDFAIEYNGNPFFSILMSCTNEFSEERVEKLLIEKIRKDTNTLTKAKEFIEKEL